MKVVDEARWSQQLALLRQDVLGRTFEEYLVFWVDTAERLMEEKGLSAHAALQEGLEVAEETFGGLDGDYLPDMLLFIVGMWVHGQALADGMTAIEMKVLTNAAANRVLSLQEEARMESGENQAESTETR